LLYNKIDMMLMLRRLLLAAVAGLALAALPAAVLADTSLTSPSNSASVLQPTPSEALQTGQNQNSSAQADYLNDELVGGQQGPQTDGSAATPSPWGDIVAAIVLAIGLVGLITVLYRSRRRPLPLAQTTPVPEPAPASKPKTNAKAKSKAKGKSKSKKKAKK